MLELCVRQGYVPATCMLEGQLAWMLTNKQGDPCKGCNMPREQCKGRPK